MTKSPALSQNLSMDSLVAAAKEFQSNSKSNNTKRSYISDWEDFKAWCLNHKREFLPASAETFSLYITSLSFTHKISSIRRRFASISQAHKLKGFENPTVHPNVRLVWQGILRTKKLSIKHASPTLLPHIRMIIDSVPEKLNGVRDRAIILLGFAGSFRRSEICNLEVNDIAKSNEGLVIRIRRSKTDQTGKGREIGILYGEHLETCPVRAVEEWLDCSGINEGPLFRKVTKDARVCRDALCPDGVGFILKRSFEKAGIDIKEFSAHSLRAGFATVAAMAGASERSIQNQTGHTSRETLRRYIRHASVFIDNAAMKLGL